MFIGSIKVLKFENRKLDGDISYNTSWEKRNTARI